NLILSIIGPPSYDTLRGILLNCSSTLFVCTWTAIYLDIPGMDKGVVATTFCHLLFMVIVWLTPELVLTWASYQSSCAQICETDTFTGWMVMHGFFACMGGFMLYIDGEPQATLTSDELLWFVCEGSVKMPIITKADIED
ncbi:uncharacterized protein BJ212DRAFT_1551280, partial [Suillus subaureus]